jgi:DNA-directed RNA polymerase sigma subunit (sigma70/sigma32)
MRIKSWELCTEISKQMLNGTLSRSQIVEIALRRMANSLQFENPNDATDITLEQYKDIEQSRKKQPDLPVVGTAITYEEVKARNKAIVHHRINAENKLTLQQLGTMYNITRERVRQIQDRHEVSSKTLKQTNEEKHAS